MKNSQMAKQDEYRKQTQQSHYGKTEPMVEMITTNDRVQHTVATTTRTNAQEMIAADHPQEMAPTPRRAAQAITTKREKEILDNLLDYNAPCSTTEKYQIHDV
jgi:hypothetical protein